VLFVALLSGVIYADEHAVVATLSLKLDAATLFSKQRVVSTQANILTGMKLSATLTNEDVAGQHNLTTKFFDTQSLTF